MVNKPEKLEVVKLFELLHEQGLGFEDIAIKMGRRYNTVWAWATASQVNRVPCVGEWETLKRIAGQTNGN